MRRAPLLAAALTLFALAALIVAPASLVNLVLEHATRGTTTLAGAEGTIWRGRATLVAGDGQVPVAWSTDAWSLLRGQLRIRLEPPPGASAAPRGVIAVGRHAVELVDAHIDFPVAMIATPGRGFVRPAGDVTLTSRALDWSPPAARGDVGLVWRNARLAVAGGGMVALGTVSAKLTATGDRMAGPIVNEGGDVDVSGSVTLTAPAALDVALQVHPRAGSDSPFGRTFATLAPPDSGGWRFGWHGDLR